MDMRQCTLYVRLYKRTTIQVKKSVTIGEIADILGPPDIKSKVETMKIFHIPDTTKNSCYVVPIMKLIQTILKEYPNADVQSVGDPDAVIEYHHQVIKTKDFLEWLKVVIVCIIIFAGAFVCIMAYNTDVSLAKTFVAIHQMITGEEVDQPYFLSVPYSIGISIGVFIFFNHFGHKKITEDPTPMQIEMSTYEEDAEKCEISSITDDRRGEP